MIFQINNIEHKNIIYTKSIDETYLQDNKFWFSQVSKINIFFIILKQKCFVILLILKILKTK